MHRRVILLDSISNILVSAIEHECGDSCLIISSNSSIKGAIQAHQQSLIKLLGSEYKVVIYDATDSFDANTLYGVAGLVSRSGCLLIAANAEITTAIGVKPVKSFQSFIFQQLSNTSVFALFSDNKTTVNEAQLAPIKEDNQDFSLSEQQIEVVNKILSKVTTCTTTIDCIIGDRGRGKSTVLAECIINMVRSNESVIYTSAHRNNCQIIDKQLENIADNFTEYVTFYPPDYILESVNSTGKVLVIDEVASIAPRLLDELQTKFSHIICAGTSHGYEGSARGFAIRRLNKLNDSDIHVLNEPFRWHKDDPLEKCLLAQISPIKHQNLNPQALDTDNLTFELIDKTDIINDKHLYENVFSLLFEAHYQTTPSNIQRIIDDKSHQIVCVRDAHQILGIAVLVREARSNDDSFNIQVAHGNRRKQGNLFQQNMCLQLLEPHIMQHTFLRVHRIVISSSAQKNGIGSSLLRFIKDKIAREEDVLCTNFGLTQELHIFWKKNAYTLVKMGHKIDSASGTISGFYIDNTSLERIEERFNFIEQFIYQLRYIERFHHNMLNYYPEESVPHTAQLSFKHIKQKLELFTQSQINYENIKHVLYCVAKQLNEKDIIKNIDKLSKKGIHKEVREALEISIRDKIKNPAFMSRVLSITKS